MSIFTYRLVDIAANHNACSFLANKHEGYLLFYAFHKASILQNKSLSLLHLGEVSGRRHENCKSRSQIILCLYTAIKSYDREK